MNRDPRRRRPREQGRREGRTGAGQGDQPRAPAGNRAAGGDGPVSEGRHHDRAVAAYTVRMATWQVVLLAVAALIVAAVAFVVWLRRSAMTTAEATAELRAMGVELVRLPGRLRRVAADPRTPRKARLWLVALTVYVASPIDPIPDFLPGIGHLDELVIVPLALRRIRRMIPPDVWAEHFPPRNTRPSN